MRPPRLLQTVGPLLALVAARGLAHADGDDLGDLEGMLGESVVTGASRSAETSSDAPATSTTITADDLRTYGIRTIDEAVQFLAMGMTSQRNNLGFAQISARGVGIPTDWGTHVLVLIDGHVVNESALGDVYPDKMFGLPIEAMDHVEIFLGPGSVLYGTNAMLGTINVVTRRAKDIAGLRAHAEFSLSPNQTRSGALDGPAWSRFGYQYRVGLSYGAAAQVSGKPLEFTAYLDVLEDQVAAFKVGPQYNYDNPNDPRQPINVGPNAGFGAPNIWGGLDHSQRFIDPSTNLRLTWGDLTIAARENYYVHYQNETDPGFGEFNQPYNGGVEGFSDVDISYTAHLSDRFTLRPRAYFDHYVYNDINKHFTEYSCGAGLSPCSIAVPMQDFRIGAEVVGTYDWLNDGRYTTMIGTDDRILKTWGSTEATDDATHMTAVSGVYKEFGPTISAFAQQTAKVTDWLSFNAGARFDWISTSNHLSPRVAAIVKGPGGSTFKAIYSEGFRRPSPYELGFAVPGFQTAATNLVPEVVRSAELTYEQRFGAHHVKLAAYANWWNNLIGLGVDPLNSAQIQYQNLNNIRAYGVNAGYDTTHGALSLGVTANVGVSYSPKTEGEVDPIAWAKYGANQPVVATPALFGNAHAAYSFGATAPTLGVAVSTTGPQLASFALSDPGLLAMAAPGGTGVAQVPWSFQLRTTLTGEVPHVAGLGYRVMVNVAGPTIVPYTVGPLNIYRPTGGTPQPDFQQISRLTAMVGLDYRF